MLRKKDYGRQRNKDQGISRKYDHGRKRKDYGTISTVRGTKE